MATRKKVPWSHWDRLLFIVLGLIFVLVVSGWFWLRALNKNPEVVVPTPTMPANNAFDYYIAAGHATVDSPKVEYARNKLPPGQKPSGDQRNYTLAEKEALVVQSASAFKILHRGFRYPFQAPPVRSFGSTSTMFPGFQSMRGLARVLSLQAEVEAEKDNWNGAMNTDLDAIQMGETMLRGGSLIEMLTGVACQALGRRHAWEIVSHLNAAQSRTAARRLEQIRTEHVLFADTLQEEEWMEQASLQEAMRRPDWSSLGGFLDSSDDSRQTDWQKRGNMLRLRMTSKRTIMANYTHYMDQEIANARQPYAAHLANPPIPADPINQWLPDFSKARIREASANTQNALLLVMLALRAYQLDHGAYPASLSALTAQYLKAVPDDPYDLASPLRYKLIGSKYLLYSIGPDGKDDGGKPIFDSSQPAPDIPGFLDKRYVVTEDSTGDVVGGVNF